MCEQIEEYKICPKCGKVYRCLTLENELGNISKEKCPFCGEEINQSESFSFYTFKK